MGTDEVEDICDVVNFYANARDVSDHGTTARESIGLGFALRPHALEQIAPSSSRGDALSVTGFDRHATQLINERVESEYK